MSIVKGLGIAEVPFQLSSLKLGLRTRVSYRILSLGGKQDGSRMIAVCESMLTCAYACACVATRGSGGILNLDPFRLLLTQSGTNFLNNILMIHTYVSNM